MSEVELHTIRNRLERGRLHKAARGELCYGVPMGYVRVGKSAYPNGRGRGQKWLPMEQWRVLIKDHLPASITWQR